MKPFQIHKPTHKFFAPSGTPAIAIGQLRGDILYMNRIGQNGEVVEKCRAVGTCAYHLCGYGHGVAAHEALSVDSMQNAWRFVFSADVAPPAFCERV